MEIKNNGKSTVEFLLNIIYESYKNHQKKNKIRNSHDTVHPTLLASVFGKICFCLVTFTPKNHVDLYVVAQRQCINSYMTFPISSGYTLYAWIMLVHLLCLSRLIISIII